MYKATGICAPLKRETRYEPCASVTTCPCHASPLHAGVPCRGDPLLCPGGGRRAPAAVRCARVTRGRGDAHGHRRAHGAHRGALCTGGALALTVAIPLYQPYVPPARGGVLRPALSTCVTARIWCAVSRPPSRGIRPSDARSSARPVRASALHTGGDCPAGGRGLQGMLQRSCNGHGRGRM